MNEKLERVKAMMVRNHRFFATLLMSREWIENDKLEAVACTDGKSITFNTLEASQYTDEEVLGVLAHELTHIFGKHHLRFLPGMNFETYSEASDYAVNMQLLAQGFKLPPTKFIDYQFDGMCLEQIYNILMQRKAEQKGNENEKQNEQSNNGKSGDGASKLAGDKKKKEGKGKSQAESGQKKAPEGGFDYVEPEKNNNGSTLSEAERSMKEMEMNIIINQAARIAKQAGQFSSQLEQLFDTLRKAETDWTEELRELVQVQTKNDYTWAHPNKRYIHKGLYLPSLHSMEIGNMGVILDVSGSITSYAEMLSLFMTQLKLLLEELKTTATILCVNTTITNVYEEVTSDDIDHLKIKGGGGTDFVPGFKWFENADPTPSVVIYFTDLKCSSYPEEPDYPVIWAVYGNKQDRTVPFGTVINLK